MFTIKAIDVTAERKTADACFEHIKQVIEEQQQKYLLETWAVISDAAGESKKCRKLLVAWRPSIVGLDCFSHQFNLLVGGKHNAISLPFLLFRLHLSILSSVQHLQLSIVSIRSNASAMCACRLADN